MFRQSVSLLKKAFTKSNAKAHVRTFVAVDKTSGLDIPANSDAAKAAAAVAVAQNIEVPPANNNPTSSTWPSHPANMPSEKARVVIGDMSSEEMVRLNKEHNIWTWSAQKAVNPLAIAKTENIYLWTPEGKRYVDANSMLMCSNLGHGNKKVIQAIKDQADEMTMAGPMFAHKSRAEFGPLLSSITPPGLDKFFFALGGAEANENALKVARFYTGRNKILARYRSYHGASHATVTLTGDPRRWQNEPGMPGVVRVFDPFMYRSLLFREGMSEEEFSVMMLAQLEETIMYEGPNNIAAMFLETVTGTNGIIVPPKGYLPGLRKLLDKYGILMVCDEVMCGVGRTGKWFAVDHWDVVPDIITMAKGVTAAYLPLGVCAVRRDIVKHFDEKPYMGGLTYNAHPMLLGTGTAVLNLMKEEKIVDHVANMGVILKKRLRELKDKHLCVGDVRSIGLFSCIELVRNRKTKEPVVPYNATSPIMVELQAFLKDNDVLMFNQWNMLHLNPPLIINEQQLNDLLDVVDRGLDIVDKYYKKEDGLCMSKGCGCSYPCK